jgi:outer membrane murein-binding lipoprotein Lpp
MKKVFVLFLLVGGFLLTRCSDAKKDEAACAVDDVNPNRSSELALLMRKMAAHAEACKAEVATGQLSGAFPEEFRNILTATPTDGQIKGKAFDLFATAYLQNLEALYSGNGELDTRYNALVGSCAACHEQSCPGPLVRINKLKI